MGYNVMVNDYIVPVGGQTNYRTPDRSKLNITICTAENNLQAFVHGIKNRVINRYASEIRSESNSIKCI